MNAINQASAGSGYRLWLTAALLGVLVSACGGGGGRDPILGGGGNPALAPTVTSVTPLNNATGVPLSGAAISATFSEPMNPFSTAGTFTVTCAAPCISPAGSAVFESTGRTATFVLANNAALTPLTQYTATITGPTARATGLALAAPYVWRFTTGVAPDSTRPRVILTVPATTLPGPTPGVPANTAVTALFSENMAPATINGASFTLTCAAPCVSPAGNVSYSTGTRTATFLPNAALAVNTTYTATITTAATDLSGNALAGNQAPLPAASNYIWTFTTVAATPPGNISVASTNPSAGLATVCPNATINATFNVPSGGRLDPQSVTSATFTVTGPAPGLTPVVAASVVLDVATGRIATFTPNALLIANQTYTARLVSGASGVRDLAIPANTLLADFTWTFTVIACANPPSPIQLGTASPFGAFGGSAGVTNMGLLTIINGDLGTTAVSTAVTGFHDNTPGCTYTETPLNNGTVNGKIYTAPPPPTPQCPNEGTAATFAIASKARLDALTAYNTLVAMPPGLDPGAGNLANLVLAPGTYTSAAGSFMIQGGDLTLDAQGNGNAVFVFQMASSLLVGGPGAAFPRSVRLINGAQAKNVFWQVGTAATINAAGGGTFEGTVIAQSGVAVSTAGNVTPVVINGRLLSLGASVTVVNTIINVPSP